MGKSKMSGTQEVKGKSRSKITSNGKRQSGKSITFSKLPNATDGLR